MEGTCGVCGIASVTLLRLTLSDAAGETDRVDLCAGCASRAYIAVDDSDADRVEFGLDALATEVNNHAV
jgi:hypothetical protein